MTADAPPRTRYGLDVDRYPTPAQFLHAIGDRISRLGLFRELRTNTTLYRVRYCNDGRDLKAPADLGPPPADQAVMSNRMSPPGVVMFYAALDPDTALAETVDRPGRFAIGEFRAHRPVWLLDFTQLPPVPGLFARIPDSQPWVWRDAQFFHDLMVDFTRPVARDDRVHIEYIPTQVVTEYCRLVFHHEHRTKPLDGILYPSARRTGHTAVVLFANREAVAGIEPSAASETDSTWLELIDVKYRDLIVTDVESLKHCEDPDRHNGDPVDSANKRGP